MKKLLISIILFLSGAACLAQTSLISIDGTDMEYSFEHEKLYVLTRQTNQLPPRIIEVDPLTGETGKKLDLELYSDPGKIKLTTREQYAYIACKNAPTVFRVALPSLELDAIIDVGSVEGYSDNDIGIHDIEVLPYEDDAFVIARLNKETTTGSVDVAMFSGDSLLPLRIICEEEGRFIDELCISPDGTRAFGHNGLVSSFDGYFFDITENGLILDKSWNLLLGTYGEVKSHGNILYSNYGQVVDGFSDSIPIMLAKLSTIDIWAFSIHLGNAFAYSGIHDAYIHTEFYEPESYLNFFSSLMYNYIGSSLLELDTRIENYLDLAVIDVENFVVLTDKGLVLHRLDTSKKGKMLKIPGLSINSRLGIPDPD